MRCVRLYTSDGLSHVEEGELELPQPRRDDHATDDLPASRVRFQHSPPGSSFAWHDAPARQLVVTLRGTLDFTTRDGERFTLRAGDVLLAEDTTGSGHEWTIVGEEPWERCYVVLAEGAEVPFRADGAG